MRPVGSNSLLQGQAILRGTIYGRTDETMTGGYNSFNVSPNTEAYVSERREHLNQIFQFTPVKCVNPKLNIA